MTGLTRAERLRQVRELNDRWVTANLASASALFDSSDRDDGSDYSIHHVEVDADGAAQDEFFAAAMRLFPSSVAAPATVDDTKAETERLLDRALHIIAHGTHNQKDHGRRLPKAGNLGDSAFAAFTRPQLRDAAKRRGIALEPRESRESIERKLAHHLAGDEDSGKPEGTGVAKDARTGQVEDRIRQAYEELQERPGEWIALADVRERLSDLDRADVDEALKRLAVAPGIQVIPWDNRNALQKRDHEAALRFGGQQNHAIRFDPAPARAEKPVDTADSSPTAAPTRMTEAQYTNILKAENARLHRLDGTSGNQTNASIDELKERNTALRKALRAKGVDYRTEEQKRDDDEEKNRLLDEVEQLAVAGGHDGPAKRAGASKMSKRELASFVADAKEFQRRRNAKQDAEGKGSAAVSAFKAAEDKSRATPRQVGYIKGLLRERGLSGDGGGPKGGPTSTEDIRKLSNAEARAYINRLLRGDY